MLKSALHGCIVEVESLMEQMILYVMKMKDVLSMNKLVVVVTMLGLVLIVFIRDIVV